MWTPAERADFAADLRVDPQNVVRTYCMRLNSAIASGRLWYQEWQGLIDMDRYPEARERAMQVLRDEATRARSVPAAPRGASARRTPRAAAQAFATDRGFASRS
jgi:hypothetical protein